VSGIILFNMIAFPPLDACSYIGIDSGASPVSLSLFFDILLACCDGITREEYVNGQFKTNLPAFSNKATVLKQCRKTLWKSLHDIKIHNITVGENMIHVYMDNETFGHKKIIFDAFQYSDKANKDKTNCTNYINCLTKASNISSTFNSCQSLFVNSIVTKTELNVESPVYLFNCDFKSNNLFYI
ncbi:L-fucose kinase isoform X2, partial [Brachionus plicatilis]